MRSGVFDKEEEVRAWKAGMKRLAMALTGAGSLILIHFGVKFFLSVDDMGAVPNPRHPSPCRHPSPRPATHSPPPHLSPMMMWILPWYLYRPSPFQVNGESAEHSPIPYVFQI